MAAARRRRLAVRLAGRFRGAFMTLHLGASGMGKAGICVSEAVSCANCTKGGCRNNLQEASGPWFFLRSVLTVNKLVDPKVNCVITGLSVEAASIRGSSMRTQPPPPGAAGGPPRGAVRPGVQPQAPARTPLITTLCRAPHCGQNTRCAQGEAVREPHLDVKGRGRAGEAI